MEHNAELEYLRHTIDELNQKAWEVRVNDSNLALELSDEALRLSESIQYTLGQAEGLRTSGFCLLRLSKNEEAKYRCEEALKLYKSLHHIRGEGYIYTGLGIIQRNFGDYPSSLELFFRSLELIIQSDYTEIEPLVYYHIGITYKYMGNLEQALGFILKSLKKGREVDNWIAEAYTLNSLGSIYEELGDYINAVKYHEESLKIRKNSGDKWGEAGSLNDLGNISLMQGEFEKALLFCNESLSIAQSVGDKKGEANSYFHLAKIKSALNEQSDAFECAIHCLKIREYIGDKKGQAEIFLCLADLWQGKTNGNESTSRQLEYLEKALILGTETAAQDLLSKIHNRFYKLFRSINDFEKALEHFELSNSIEKDIHSKTLRQKILNLEISHKIEQSKKETEIYRLRNVELADLYEISKRQREEIQAALTDLKSTQAQLIQSEKMASLGELTAGIAHEIQNPLNFVNNFSDVNIDLLIELKDEINKGNLKEVAAIADDLISNEEKINHHGKRADAIVKGMLAHSKSGTGKKELTNLNALTEEYLRLAFGGMLAKDKSFSANYRFEPDPNLPKMEVVPQDIGRVLLNLINNAFYACTERTLLSLSKGNRSVVNEQSKKAIPGYTPEVVVSTGIDGNRVKLVVKDNGAGIPENIKDKIFQPFFTTKPTGQGTGLGLSLSYDIVKAHGGSIETISEMGAGTRFVITLPIL